MFIKPSKKWRNPEGDMTIMVPYTYYRLCESYRDENGKTKQRTVLGLGELPECDGEGARHPRPAPLLNQICVAPKSDPRKRTAR